MRSAVGQGGGRLLRGTILAVALTAVGPVAADVRAQEAPPAPAAPETAEIAKLRRAMEDAFLGLVADRAAYRAGTLEAGAVGEPYAALLETLCAAARATPEAAVDDLLRPLRVASAGAKSPLVAPDTLIVLGRETVRRARADAAVDASGLFLAVAADVLGRDRAADTWDRWFTAAPTVIAWRRAHGLTADRGATDEASGTAVEGETPEEPAGAEPPEAPEVAETPLVQMERLRLEVGPWEGWIAELGDKAGKPQKVTVKTIWVEVHEVTCGQYLRFLAAQPPRDRAKLLPQGWTIGAADDEPAHPSGRTDHPVTGVTFAQARRYARHLGMRLPTEDEWERIATGGESTRTYPWGAGNSGKTWAHGDAQGGARPVSEADDDVTPGGVRGLAGNVAELTATLADRKPVGSRDPAADARIVIRGGSYRSRASECTARFRWTVEGGGAEAHVGFRCVMDDAAHRKRFGR